MQMPIDELSTCQHVNELWMRGAEIVDTNITQRLQKVSQDRLVDVRLEQCSLAPGIEAFLMSSPATLLHLSLCQCTGIPKGAYAHILLQCGMLKSFHLSGGTEHGISGSTLAPFLDAEHPSLEILDMERCPDITDETLECIKRGFHRTLKTLLVGWSGPLLTENVLLSACRALTNLTYLCIDDGDLLREGCIE